ncbi:hypothetical protein PGQ11_012647 [Apiospora arundinis]|uniref:Uncharacterized protein n=1 Tax=Apiospora arundinis TaxID=335852 RepID=A0ABR2I3X0_9PEZI
MAGNMSSNMTSNMAVNSSNPAARGQQGNIDISYASAVSRAAQSCDELLEVEVRNISTYAVGVHRYGVHNRAANTPFGYQIPAYSMQLERQPEEKSPFTAWGGGSGTWMGPPDPLAVGAGLSWPETVVKTGAVLDCGWTEYLDPQSVLNEYSGCEQCHGATTITDPPGCKLPKCGLGNAMHEPYTEKSKRGNPRGSDQPEKPSEERPGSKLMHKRIDELKIAWDPAPR